MASSLAWRSRAIGTVEIDLADFALFGLGVGSVCGGERRLWCRLAEEHSNYRRWPFGHVDLLCRFGEWLGMLLRVFTIGARVRVGVFGIERGGLT